MLLLFVPPTGQRATSLPVWIAAIDVGVAGKPVAVGYHRWYPPEQQGSDESPPERAAPSCNLLAPRIAASSAGTALASMILLAWLANTILAKDSPASAGQRHAKYRKCCTRRAVVVPPVLQRDWATA